MPPQLRAAVSGVPPNLLKAALAVADVVVTVSPTHARELTFELGGFGLHESFRALGGRLLGISNGIDQRAWDPGLDRTIAANYTACGTVLSGGVYADAQFVANLGTPGNDQAAPSDDETRLAAIAP